MIRDATRDDLEAIVAIYNAAIAGRASTADLEPVTVASRRAWLEGRDPSRRPVWVLEASGEVAGWLAFQDFKARAAYRPTADLGVYVSPDHRRSGVGRALLEHAIERAPSLAVSTLLGVVFAHNPASIGLFASAGFAEWGRLPGVTELDGVERDVLILGRRV